MSDHFRTVGFTLERGEFDSLLQRTLDGGTSIAAPNGDYRVWTPGAGAELWVSMYRLPDGRRKLAGMNPHFAGGARMQAIVEAARRNDDFVLEGEIYAWASLGDEEHGLYPFSASVPDYDSALASRELPFRTELELAGFAHDVTWWEDDAAYRRSRSDEPTGFAATSFVPTGLFGNNTGRARSQCIVTGTVRSAEIRFNMATERTFWHLRLALYGGEIDVVASPEAVCGAPAEGAVVRASCWLTARIA